MEQGAASGEPTQQSAGVHADAGPVLDRDDLLMLRLLAEGHVVEAVARRTGLSERTVRRRYRTICDVLGVRAPIQAVVWAARRGLL